MSNIINTQGGKDFSAVQPAILINTNGDYVAISGVSGGTGDVVGPGSSTANAVALFSNTTGKLIKNSTFVVAGNDLTIPGIIYVPDGGGIVSSALNQAIQISASSGVSIGGNTGNVNMSTGYPGNATVAAGKDATFVATSGTALFSSSSGPATVHAKTDILLDANAKLLIATTAVSGTIGARSVINIDDNVGLKYVWDDGAGNVGTVQNNGYPTLAFDGGGNHTFLSCYPTQILTKGDFFPVGTSGTALIGTAAHPYGAVYSDALIVKSPNGNLWKLTITNAGVVSGVSYP